jgi:hypothetical protein
MLVLDDMLSKAGIVLDVLMFTELLIRVVPSVELIWISEYAKCNIGSSSHLRIVIEVGMVLIIWFCVVSVGLMSNNDLGSNNVERDLI